MIKTAAIIITYNSAGFVAKAVSSAREYGLLVIVIDNASTDRSAEEAREAGADLVIVNEANLGFAGAANQGFLLLDEKYQCVLLLNPDVEITTSLNLLIDACLSHGAACGQLYDIDNNIQTGFQVRRFPTPVSLVAEVLGINRVWPNNPLNRHYRYLDLDFTRAAVVDQPAAAFLMVRRDVWLAVEGFDTQFYPVWFEDVDFCKRIKDKGFSIAYQPAVRARHIGGHSVGKIPYANRVTTWYASLLKYGQKHFSSAGLRITAAAVLLGAVPRCVLGIYEERSQKPIAVWLSMCNLCMQVLIFGQGGIDGNKRFYNNRGF